MNERDTGNFFAGFMVGAIIGVALGFLFAPQSGVETREMIKSKAEKAKEKAGELSEKVKQMTSDIKEKIQS